MPRSSSRRHVIGPTPRLRPRSSRTGTSGMISSSVFSTAPSVANTTATTATAQRPRRRNAQAMAATRRDSVPMRSTTTKAPPTNNVTAMTSAASMKPLRNCHGRGKGTDRRGRHAMIGAGDHHDPSSCRIGATVVLACRQHPCESGGDDNGRHEEGEGMRKPERHRAIGIISRRRRCRRSPCPASACIDRKRS